MLKNVKSVIHSRKITTLSDLLQHEKATLAWITILVIIKIFSKINSLQFEWIKHITLPIWNNLDFGIKVTIQGIDFPLQMLHLHYNLTPVN